MKIKILIVSFISLLFGTVIYLLLRPASLKVFYWLNLLNIDFLNSDIRKTIFKHNKSFPDWFLYSLPDGLWITSYVCLMFYIWNFKINYSSIFWISIVPVIAIFSEIGQLLKLVQGTFDLSDLIFYLLGFIIPILFIMKNKHLTFIKNL